MVWEKLIERGSIEVGIGKSTSKVYSKDFPIGLL